MISNATLSASLHFLGGKEAFIYLFLDKKKKDSREKMSTRTNFFKTSCQIFIFFFF